MAWMKRWILRLRLYQLAAWLYETYRLIAKPRTHGALGSLWHQRQVLLVATSYRRELSLPGAGSTAAKQRAWLRGASWGRSWVYRWRRGNCVNPGLSQNAQLAG